MEKLYNARLSYKGEGNFTFTLANYGELTIYNGRDLFVKGLTTAAVENLRQLRALNLQHQLNAKQEGCYKVIDLEGKQVKPALSRVNMAKVPESSIANLKANLIKTVGPIIEDEPVVVNETAILEPSEVSEEDTVEVIAPEVVIENSDGDVKTNEPSVPAPAKTTAKKKTNRRIGAKKSNKKK